MGYGDVMWNSGSKLEWVKLLWCDTMWNKRVSIRAVYGLIKENQESRTRCV